MPDDRTGASIRVVPPQRKHPAVRELADQEQAAEAAHSGLASVRKTAENWRLGMSGLVTLTTATLLFKGRSTIQDYSELAKWVLGILVLASLAAGVVSVFRFLRAAYGEPKVVRVADVADAGGLDAYNLSLAQAALDSLSTARRWAVASLVLLALGIACSWYFPSAEQTVLVRVTYTSGDVQMVQCGTLKTVDGKMVHLAGAGPISTSGIPLSQLVSLVAVKGC
jgi:hypothetical protein